MNNNLLGIVSITAAMVIISLQDTMVKQFHASYALHEIMVVRAGTALACILVFVWIAGELRALKTRNFPYLMLRGLMLVIANSCFFLGLASMPVAQNVALFFIAPMLITSASALILREPVGPRRWTAVVVGLLGVVVVLRPDDGIIRWEAFLPIMAASAYACMQLMARRMGTVETAATMVVYMQLTLLSFSLIVGLFAGDGRFSGGGHVSTEFLLRAWQTPSLSDLALWILMGMLNVAGGYLMTQAYRVANAALVAPFEFVAIPCSVCWGFALYAEIPDRGVLLGIALILGSGMYIGHRELTLARARKGGDAAPT
ncbi:MAG: DMT family transporter [Pseudomonadota bacterium]